MENSATPTFTEMLPGTVVPPSAAARPPGGAAWALLALAAACVVGALIWQGVAAGGTPDPTRTGISSGTALFDIGVLVFREGLEFILVLSAILAGLGRGGERSRSQPIVWGAAAGVAASVATWFVAVGIVDALSENVSALNLQAATGLLAVVVLLVIMNWFFHKVYWGGWIGAHNRRRKALVVGAAGGTVTQRSLFLGLAALGFTSLYREGFEIVLFLQTYRLQLGERIVLSGLGVGLVLVGLVAVLTFVAHRRLPYRRMLELTGVLLGAVLLLMVGEQAQEMQLAHWIPRTEIPWLAWLPDWTGMWFAVFPTVETLGAQALAAALVIGSYFAARRQSARTAAPSEAVPTT